MAIRRLIEDNCGMCGFVAMIGIAGDQPDVRTITRMADSIAHRGPDEYGNFLEGNVGFGFRRLSILDLSAHGHQPMFSDDNHLMIVFNGEIYNYIEIREQLIGLGHSFRSTGDTEVLLKAYLQWGEDCLDRLNGMWSFLIYDRRKGTIFGSRDRFGIKPLYFVRTNEWMILASEIKALWPSRVCRPSINWTLAAEYLLEGRLSEPDDRCETLYSDVFEIPAGSAFRLGLDGSLKQWRYWQLSPEPAVSVGNPFQRFADLFEDSVRLRMRSDVSVGVCLSGGLDSTSIICHMSRLLGGRSNSSDGDISLEAFNYMSKDFDESEQVNATIMQTGASLNRFALRPNELWERLGDVVAYHDEPVHSMNVVVGYELYRMSAANGVKVILNGQGADESLAGYASYFNQYWYALLKSARFGRCWTEIKEFTDNIGANPLRTIAHVLRYTLQTQFARVETYRSVSHRKRLQRARRDEWFNGDLHNSFDPAKREFRDPTLDTSLRSSMETDPLPLYLRVEDRNSMAHSVETRLPFLDYRLVNFVFGLADELKLRGPLNKFVLREAMRDRIPETVRARVEKFGFPVPQARWFATGLRPQLQELLNSRAVRERGIYNVDRIRKDLESLKESNSEISHRLFRIVQFEMFCDLHERYVAAQDRHV